SLHHRYSPTVEHRLRDRSTLEVSFPGCGAMARAPDSGAKSRAVLPLEAFGRGARCASRRLRKFSSRSTNSSIRAFGVNSLAAGCKATPRPESLARRDLRNRMGLHWTSESFHHSSPLQRFRKPSAGKPSLLASRGVVPRDMPQGRGAAVLKILR